MCWPLASDLDLIGQTPADGISEICDMSGNEAAWDWAKAAWFSFSSAKKASKIAESFSADLQAMLASELSEREKKKFDAVITQDTLAAQRRFPSAAHPQFFPTMDKFAEVLLSGGGLIESSLHRPFF